MNITIAWFPDYGDIVAGIFVIVLVVVGVGVDVVLLLLISEAYL